LAALTLVGKAGGTDWIWDYECDCGLTYRVRAVGSGAVFWASNGPGSFSHRFVYAGTECVKCGRQLTLEGCSFRHDPPSTTPGAAVRMDLRCASCGYGAIASRMPARCPMCGGSDWDFADWRPFSRRARLAAPPEQAPFHLNGTALSGTDALAD
jgi:hypothetical protein